MKRVIILNGPPNSGKDTLADALSLDLGYQHLRFKDILYLAVSEYYEVPMHVVYELCLSRELKETPTTVFRGSSPRDAMIHVSENVMKPKFGMDYFGVRLATTIAKSDSHFFVISDGGFEAEIVPMVEKHQLFIVRLQRDDCNFDGDSRRYLENYDVIIENNGDVDEAVVAIHDAAYNKFR